MATNNEIIQKCYLAYYGRPGDAGGIAYWSARLEFEKGNLSSVIDSFANSVEANSLYGGLDSSQKISKIYQQLFQRAPDQGGHDYYLDQLNTGKMSLSSIMLNVADGASGDDLAKINKNIQDGLSSLDATQLSKMQSDYLAELAGENQPNQSIDLTTFTTGTVVDAGTGAYNFVLDITKVAANTSLREVIQNYGADDSMTIFGTQNPSVIGFSGSPHVMVTAYGPELSYAQITLVGTNPEYKYINGIDVFNAQTFGDISLG